MKGLSSMDTSPIDRTPEYIIALAIMVAVALTGLAAYFTLVV